jgi:hypothetical protein
MVQDLGLSAYLACQFKLTEIKSTLKLYGPPTSGHRKVDLASRLIEADPEGMRKAAVEESNQTRTDRMEIRIAETKKQAREKLQAARNSHTMWKTA